jgi:hypothetical protein
VVFVSAMKYDKKNTVTFQRGMIAITFRISYIDKMEDFKIQCCLQTVKKSKKKYVHEPSEARN